MSVVTATIKSGGEPIEQSINIIQLEALYEVNRIPSAQLIVADGSIPNRLFAMSHGAFFELGNNSKFEGMRFDDKAKWKKNAN